MCNKNKILFILLIASSLITLVSCGSDHNSSSSAPVQTQQEQQQGDEGIYRAVLAPMNTKVAGDTEGTVEIVIEGDDFRVISNVKGAPAGAKHLQNVTLGTTCPIPANDVNGDSFVDIAEIVPSTGPILIPLDSDLSEQINGMTYGPIANSAGNYVYRRSTSLTDLLNDLRSPDPDMQDPIAKLPDTQNLNLAGKVVIIHGVSLSANLPSSVATIGDIPREQVLPIACGQFVRVKSEEDPTTTGGSTTGTSTTSGTTDSSTTGGTTTSGTSPVFG